MFLRGNTYCFEGRQGDVSDELGASGRNSKADGLVLDGVFLAGGCLEHILEDFVEAELAEALSSVSNERGEPALKEC